MKIHLLGPSGSGTTTLGRGLSQKLLIPHFDTDDYFWLKTDPSYIIKRPVNERIKLLSDDLQPHDSWILSGSMLKWGDFLIKELDLIIYKYLPQEARLKRLKKRETERFGSRIKKGNDMYQIYMDFMNWARSYETGSLNMRSKLSEEEWLRTAGCPVLRLEDELTLDEEIKLVLNNININKRML